MMIEILPYQSALDSFLAVSDMASGWFVRRCECMMSGKPGKTRFIDEHVLPDLRTKEREALTKLIEVLGKYYPMNKQDESKS